MSSPRAMMHRQWQQASGVCYAELDYVYTSGYKLARIEKNPLNSTFSSERLTLKSLQTSVDQRHNAHAFVLIFSSATFNTRKQIPCANIKMKHGSTPGVNVPCLGYAVDVMLHIMIKKLIWMSVLWWSEKKVTGKASGDGRDRWKRGRQRGLDLKSVIPFH